MLVTEANKKLLRKLSKNDFNIYHVLFLMATNARIGANKVSFIKKIRGHLCIRGIEYEFMGFSIVLKVAGGDTCHGGYPRSVSPPTAKW